jgi:hypothetical protein
VRESTHRLVRRVKHYDPQWLEQLAKEFDICTTNRPLASVGAPGGIDRTRISHRTAGLLQVGQQSSHVTERNVCQLNAIVGPMPECDLLGPARPCEPRRGGLSEVGVVRRRPEDRGGGDAGRLFDFISEGKRR